MSTTGNNTSIPLAAGATFTGAAQLTTGFTNILVSVKVDKKSELTIQQSANKTHWDLDSVWTCDPANDPFGFTIQTPVALPYFRVKLENTTAQNMTALRLVSVLNLTSNVKLTPQQDNTLVSGEDADKKKHTLQTTSTGDLIINGTGGSATRNVHYLVVGDYYRVASVGITSGAEWNAIGAIVAGESEPTIGRLFKCLSIGALYQNGGECYDVEYTDSVTVSIPPNITGSVDILPATDPSLTIGKVRMADFYGDPILTTAGNLMVGINNIYTANPLHTILDSGSVIISSGAITETNSGTISSTLTSLNGKVTACNTGAVVITTLPSIPTGANVIGGVTTSHTTSSVTSWENPTSIISFDSGNTVRQIKGNAGSLHSLAVTNDNNALAYVALYDELAINVTAGVTIPKAVFTINKNQQIQLPLHAVAFSTAISYFTATTYSGGTPLTSVYLTASYNG